MGMGMEWNGNAEGEGDEHENGNRNGEDEGNENENEEGENDSRDEQEMYRSLLNQLNEFAQRSREDSGISIEMESDDHDRENDNHVPIVMNGGDNENSEDENDNYDDYDDYDDDDDEIHDDDVVVPGPAAEILFPNGEGIVGVHNPHGFDTIRGDVYRRTGTAASPASRLVERRWLDGVDDKGVPLLHAPAVRRVPPLRALPALPQLWPSPRRLTRSLHHAPPPRVPPLHQATAQREHQDPHAVHRHRLAL